MTRLLLDTHLVLWWLNGNPQLPHAVVERVQAPEAEVFVIRVLLPGFRWLPFRVLGVGIGCYPNAGQRRQQRRQGWLKFSNENLMHMNQHIS